MIACAFAACSNEDDPIVGPDQPQTGENNATLTISVKNVARSLTKAAAEGTQTENEAKITNLTVALYDAETERLSLQPLILPMRMLLRIMMRFNLPD